MTKKDYQIIADSIGHALGLERVTENKDNKFWKEMGIQTTIISLIFDLKKENPRFDEDKFKKAIEEKAKKTEENLTYILNMDTVNA
jgi:hypothetical protein